MALGEFELIAAYFTDIGPARAGVDLAVGDDCALLTPPASRQLAISVDTLVADVHFPARGDAHAVAQKALRSNLSDLAAMGAEPLAFTLALSLPQVDDDWLADFSRGLRDDADAFGIPLIGGDTTRAPATTITLQVIGALPPGSALRRDGARSGDAIFVSGTLGDARAALASLPLPAAQLNADQRYFLSRYFRPTPRLALGVALRNIAGAAIDVSDGLAADLGHILERSSTAVGSPLGAVIDPAKLPLSAALRRHPEATAFALGGGDDYELCFTVPQRHKPLIAEIAHSLSLPLAEIGSVMAGSGLQARADDGSLQPLAARGYQHFTGD